MKKKKDSDNEITVLQTTDGKINIEVLYGNENIWLPQKRMAELFNVDRSVVTRHLKNIFTQKELQEESVCANYAHTTGNGKFYQTKFYSLEAIIVVGYMVNSERGTQFRQWATQVQRQHLLQGYTLHQVRFVQNTAELEQAMALIRKVARFITAIDPRRGEPCVRPCYSNADKDQGVNIQGEHKVRPYGVLSSMQMTGEVQVTP